MLGFLDFCPEELHQQITREIDTEYWAHFSERLFWVSVSWVSRQNSAPSWVSQASRGYRKHQCFLCLSAAALNMSPALYQLPQSEMQQTWLTVLSSLLSWQSPFRFWLLQQLSDPLNIFYKFYLTFLVVLSRSIGQLQAIPSQLEEQFYFKWKALTFPIYFTHTLWVTASYVGEKKVTNKSIVR